MVELADENDNSPSLELLESQISVFEGRVVEPFLFKVRDADGPLAGLGNEVRLAGPLADQFRLDRLTARVFNVVLTGAVPNGVHRLRLELLEEGHLVHLVDVKLDVSGEPPVRFLRPKFKRRVMAAGLRKGKQVLRLELADGQREQLDFVLLEGNPGWLTLDPLTGRLLVADLPE